RSHGMVLAADGKKMSKSLGNVINPDDVVKKYGADTIRLYEMFMGPYEETVNWSIESLEGCYRFLKRVWNIFNDAQKIGKITTKELTQKINYTIKKISGDLESMKFNTAVSTMMEFLNAWSEKENTLSKKDAEGFLKILAPFCPHIAEELWSKLGPASVKTSADKHKTSIFKEKWPEYDERLLKKDTIELVIQINGKVRDKIEVSAEISKEEAEKLALNSGKIKTWLNNQKPKVVIFVKGKLINIVV
ncbi:MAG: class I tRNA ligase family protein, partial [bacterium]|nr:class I tRNA ligase family protein [bacterium]